MSSIKKSYRTPPATVSTPPLTPPPSIEKSIAIQTIVTAIRSLKNPRRLRKKAQLAKETWSAHILDTQEYEDLRRCIRQDRDKTLWGFFLDEVRYDYFPSNRTFVLRMPTIIHESIIRGVAKRLETQIIRISESVGVSAEFAKEIDQDLSATIDFDDADYGSHSPDAQFRHSQARYPGVVLEVAFSQKGKDLGRIADDYILGSDGDIRMVIGIDVDLNNTTAGWVSVWEPRIVKNEAGEDELVAQQTTVNEPLCDTSGSPNNSATISFPLRNLATDEIDGDFQDNISISAQSLCDILEHATSRAATIQEGIGRKRTIKPWTRKRAREISPEETLLERDEKKFRMEEEKMDSKTKDDASYKTDSQGSSFKSDGP